MIFLILPKKTNTMTKRPQDALLILYLCYMAYIAYEGIISRQPFPALVMAMAGWMCFMAILFFLEIIEHRPRSESCV